MTPVYTISELAKEFKITTRAIRHYEDVGLLSPQRDGINRLFGNRDRARLKLALRARRLGISLAEIRELFDLYDNAGNERRKLEGLLAKLERHRIELEQRSEDIAAMLDEFAFFENQCRRSLAGSHRQTVETKPA
jgi:DNA-binding transcriptional MerR regulator